MTKIQNIFVEAFSRASEAERRELLQKFVAYLRLTRQLSKSRELLTKIEQELERRAERPVIKGEVAHEGILPYAQIKTNPALLAGAKLRAGEKSVDASMMNRLRKLYSLIIT